MLRRCAAVLCLALASTGSGVLLGAPAPASSAIAVTVREDRIAMPSTIRPGVQEFAVTFRGGDSGLALMAPESGYTVGEYRDDVMAATFQTGRTAVRAGRSLAANVRQLGGVTGERGQTLVFWQKIPRGRLWATQTDFSGTVAERAEVRGDRSAKVLPKAVDLAVTDGAISSLAPIATGSTLRVRNTGTEPHGLAALRLKPGKTLADVQAFVAAYEAAEEDSPPGVEDPVDETAPSIATQSLSPGAAIWVRHGLLAGSYLLICVELDVSDPDVLRMHLQNGELAVVSIS